MSRSIVVQSVLYGNEPASVLRSVAATAHALSFAVKNKTISTWYIALGDSLPTGTLSRVSKAALKKLVTEAGGSLIVDEFGENLGHGGGHNRLALQTHTELMLILNPDVVLAFDAIAELCSSLTSNVGATDARQLPLEHAKDYDPLTRSQSWASGACLLTTREIFDTIGGFDHETFFMYCDDVDYSWRVRLAGYDVVYSPAARAFHDKRLMLDGNIEAGEAEHYYSAEAAILLAYKYSKPKHARTLLNHFKNDNSENSRRVVREIERRIATNTLPVALDSRHQVAYFQGGRYAPHRY